MKEDKAAAVDTAERDVLMFFNEHPASLPLFEAFRSELFRRFPDISMRVQKTQISFYRRYMFVCVSLLRVRRKAELPDPYIVVTLGLPCPLVSDRVAVITEAYPGRWTTHIVVGSCEELDSELYSWVEEAYAFAGRK